MKLLVNMRADALRLSSSSSSSSTSSLKPLADSIKTSLSEWFSVGMLQLRQLTWENTPAALLEKIVQGEAIHPYTYKGGGNNDSNSNNGGWVDDLKRRLSSKDRRVHAFFHPAMPDEPLMVLHAALLEGGDTSPDNISTLLNQPSATTTTTGAAVVKEEVTCPHTAVFYSISSLQPGLQGIQMGDYLIKLVSQQLLQEFPATLKTLITLSPIPNFSTWLEHQYKADTLELPPSVLAMGRKEMDVIVNAYAGESYTSLIDEQEDGELSSSSSPRALFWWALNSHCWLTNEQIEDIIKPAVLHLAARYLAIEKRRGFALDPVANFHLRNGAELHNLVWRAAAPPPSTTTTTTTITTTCNSNNRMMDQSYGIMANYLYRLEDVARNNAEYLENEVIAVGDQVKEMLQR
jgi:malonyl-CoA decarboxylase